MDINECVLNFCGVGGICINFVNVFFCVCVVGYYGGGVNNVCVCILRNGGWSGWFVWLGCLVFCGGGI